MSIPSIIPTQNLSAPTFLIRFRKFSNQSIHHNWVHEKVLTDFPYMLSFANSSDIKVVNRSEMSVFIECPLSNADERYCSLSDSVLPSVCNVPVWHRNGLTCHHTFYSIR